MQLLALAAESMLSNSTYPKSGSELKTTLRFFGNRVVDDVRIRHLSEIREVVRQTFSRCLSRQTPDEELFEGLCFQVLRHLSVSLDGLVDFHHPPLYHVRLRVQDSVIGLFVFAVDEPVAFGDVWVSLILLVALSCTIMNELICPNLSKWRFRSIWVVSGEIPPTNNLALDSCLLVHLVAAPLENYIKQNLTIDITGTSN